MEAVGGALVGKEGAEGFYAIGVAPELVPQLTGRLSVADDCAAGIAIKIHDGMGDRGRHPAIMHTLKILGIDAAARPELADYRAWPLRNHAGTLVGEVRSEFDLEFL
jgi:L-asparaginase II